MTFDQMIREDVQRLYDIEQQLQGALQFSLEKAQSEDLREAITDHLAETREHTQRLEQVASILGSPVQGAQSKLVRSLVEEARMKVQDQAPSPLTDCMLISALQVGEHIEIASYGTAKTLAKRMDQDDVHDLLKKTLKEEQNADDKLSKVAESGINQMAVSSTSSGAYAG